MKLMKAAVRTCTSIEKEEEEGGNPFPAEGGERGGGGWMKGSAEKKNVHETLSRQLLPYMKKGVRNNIREEKEGELSTLHLVAKRCLERLSLPLATQPLPSQLPPPPATEKRGGGSTLNSKTPPASFSSASSAESGEGGDGFARRSRGDRESPGGLGAKGRLSPTAPDLRPKGSGGCDGAGSRSSEEEEEGGTYFRYLSPGGRSVVGR